MTSGVMPIIGPPSVVARTSGVSGSLAPPSLPEHAEIEHDIVATARTIAHSFETIDRILFTIFQLAFGDMPRLASILNCVRSETRIATIDRYPPRTGSDIH